MFAVSSSLGSDGAAKLAKIAEINRIEIKVNDILPRGRFKTLLNKSVPPVLTVLIYS
jgi:hypothetical protein